MTLLAVDVGNTHTTFGLFDADRQVTSWRVATQRRGTADELALLVRGFLALTEPTPAALTGVAVCSVVPPLTVELREMASRWFRVPAVVVEPGVRTGVPVLTDNPKEVGADRVVNALAVMHLLGSGPAVVVDFGTATVFDAVSATGQYLGSAIAPGIEVSVEALGARGAQLRRVELSRPRSVIGKSTVEALQAGILYGFAGQVDGILERMVAELGAGTTVVATGSLAPLVLAESRRVDRHEPWLTLLGLRLVWERNQPA